MIITQEKNWVIFSVEELNLLDFTEVHENSPNTLRYSSDETKTFVKFFSDASPSSLSNMTTTEGPYTYNEILNILTSSFWDNPSYPTSEPSFI